MILAEYLPFLCIYMHTHTHTYVCVSVWIEILWEGETEEFPVILCNHPTLMETHSHFK